MYKIRMYDYTMIDHSGPHYINTWHTIWRWRRYYYVAQQGERARERELAQQFVRAICITAPTQQHTHTQNDTKHMCALTCARLSTHINTTFRQAYDQQQQTYRDAQLSATHLSHYFPSLSAVFVGIGIGFFARASDSMQTYPGSDSHLRLFNPIGASKIAIARPCHATSVSRAC